MQATDQEETITIVTPSGSIITRQIKMDAVTAVQETNPATQGQMTFMKFSVPLKQWQISTYHALHTKHLLYLHVLQFLKLELSLSKPHISM